MKKPKNDMRAEDHMEAARRELERQHKSDEDHARAHPEHHKGDKDCKK